MKEKIAIFGGTFNPIHNGHIHLCMECHKQLHFDRIFLMPSNIPPHKEVGYLAKNQERYDMCCIAAKQYPILQVSDLELKMRGVSYTVYTLDKLKKCYPQAELYFIIGSDMLFSFHKWHRYEDILSLAFLVAGARQKEELNRMLYYCKGLGQWQKRIKVLSFEAYPISSTQIRHALKHCDETIKKELPNGVWEYIEEHHLYEFGEA